jgi:hypothetical protein
MHSAHTTNTWLTDSCPEGKQSGQAAVQSNVWEYNTRIVIEVQRPNEVVKQSIIEPISKPDICTTTKRQLHLSDGTLTL